MILYITAFCVFALVIALMAVGVMLGGKRIQGSCGGLSAWTDALGRPMCEACADCPEKKHECELEPAHASGSGGGRSVPAEFIGRVDRGRATDESAGAS